MWIDFSIAGVIGKHFLLKNALCLWLRTFAPKAAVGTIWKATGQPGTAMLIIIVMDDARREKYMTQALHLAAKGAGRVAPNPLVGAVIVQTDSVTGSVIGTGYHRRFGQAHAEINALEDCRTRQADHRGAVMFVTLEPCCHHGKTGPCTEAIIAAGISKVEIATLDDCPLVAGGGAQALTAAGIEVIVGCCEHQARRQNAGFFKLQKSRQPQVILKWAQSINGKLARPPGDPERWISNEQSRRHTHRMRSACGAVLVGIDTVLADDPLLNVRLGRSMPQPLRVVLDSNLRLSPNCQLVQTAGSQGVLICTTASALQAHQEKVETLTDTGCTVLPLPENAGRVDISAVLDELGRRGITDVLVEGGPTILNEFWSAGAADKVAVFIAPTFIADGPGPVAPSLNFGSIAAQLLDTSTRTFSCDVLVEGYLKNLPQR